MTSSSHSFQALLLANIDALADLESSDVTDNNAGDAGAGAGAASRRANTVRFEDDNPADVTTESDVTAPPLSADGKFVVLRDVIESQSQTSVISSGSDVPAPVSDDVEEPESEA